jgi:hypothetical protein
MRIRVLCKGTGLSVSTPTDNAVIKRHVQNNTVASCRFKRVAVVGGACVGDKRREHALLNTSRYNDVQ